MGFLDFLDKHEKTYKQKTIPTKSDKPKPKKIVLKDSIDYASYLLEEDNFDPSKQKISDKRKEAEDRANDLL